MNVPVDIITAFNQDGTIRPKYIRLENDQHRLNTRKIANVLRYEEHGFVGMGTIEMVCQLEDKRELELTFLTEQHVGNERKVIASSFIISF